MNMSTEALAETSVISATETEMQQMSRTVAQRGLVADQVITVDQITAQHYTETDARNNTEKSVAHARYKRTFDITFILVTHMIFLPVWLSLWILIPIAIWITDRGKIFYTQERLGQGGKPFKMIKFRTMVLNAEAQTGAIWAREADDRQTRVGKILRITRLDEIPQVINIIKGDMSLVGPRPERPELALKFQSECDRFSSRLRVKPGIAGLAQVRGEYSTKPRNKLRYDNIYIQNMSTTLDIKLIFLSVWVVFKGLLKQ